MKKIIPALVIASILALRIAAFAGGEKKATEKEVTKESAAAQTAEHGLFTPGDIKWTDAPAALPPGAKLAVLEGDPTKKGLYTMRLQMPDGYKIPPHHHLQVEHVTVISGTFNLGMGEKFDETAGNEMPAGTFGFLPPTMKHFAWAKGETVIQLHGMGPWEIIYVNPADDPRHLKK
jgi:anti-sigma factor ChrR (cupin superfamily)